MSEHYECPACGKRTGFWEGIEVETWRGIDDQLEPNGQRGDHDIDWHSVNRTGNVGCAECGWEGMRKHFNHVVLGMDGKPLPEIHPAQLALGSPVVMNCGFEGSGSDG